MNPEAELLFPESRRRLIASELASAGSARVTSLARELGVSVVTIRRDLEQMERDGQARRVRGGAVLPDKAAALVQASASAAESKGAATSPPGPATEERLASAEAFEGVTIGMVVPSLAYYWPSVAQGAKDRAAHHGGQVLLRESAYESPEEDRKQIRHLLDSANVSGLLLTVDTSDRKTMDLLEQVTESGVPVVLVERQATRSVDGAPMESVTSDHSTGAVLAVRALSSLGHHRIGLISARNSPTAPHLLAGWKRACQELGIPEENTLLATINNGTATNLNDHVGHTLDEIRAKGITGVVVLADAEANAMVQLAQQRGLAVPEDLSVVAYDDEVASLFSPPLTAVRPPRITVGATAVDLIVDRLAEPERATRRVTLSPRLTIRSSTQPPRE